MTYRYRYTSEARFSPAVERHFFKLRSLPCQNEFQHLVESQLVVSPSTPIYVNPDGLGNVVQWGSLDQPHTRLRVESVGVVEQLKPYRLLGAPEPYYNVNTHLTAPSAEMYCIVDRVLGRRREGVFRQVARLMHWVHRFLNYTPGSTSVLTTAADVLHQPHGVCQDYAHLLIALCRCRGFYVRYVNGLIAGEGKSHAWVEVSDGSEWRAFDPTHDVEIEWGYIKIAHGRDADDCPINRGRFFGWTTEDLYVDVKVEIVKV